MERIRQSNQRPQDLRNNPELTILNFFYLMYSWLGAEECSNLETPKSMDKTGPQKSLLSRQKIRREAA